MKMYLIYEGLQRLTCMSKFVGLMQAQTFQIIMSACRARPCTRDLSPCTMHAFAGILNIWHYNDQP